MFPRLFFTILQRSFTFATSDLLFAFVIALAPLVLMLGMRRELSLGRALRIALVTAVAALLGGRLFHVGWERPRYFLDHPSEILTRLDGLVLYGSLLAGMVALHLQIRKLPARERAKIWDLAAIYGAFTVAMLRISCFAEGCCWGKPTTVKWAVRYFDPNSSMPWLGIPVHPVQLYESFFGLMIALHLGWVRRRFSDMRGLLIFLFCLEYSVVRFGLEYFRGDDFRGVNLFLGLSTSQLISLVVGSVSLLALKIRLTGDFSGHPLALSGEGIS